MGTPAQSRRYRFGLFEADPAAGELLRQGVRVRVQDQPFRLLTILLERPGEVVPREEVRERLWPADTYVEFDGSLKAALKRLREALGDSAENPIFIETLPKRGYRFIAPVAAEDEPPMAEAQGLSVETQVPPQRVRCRGRRSADAITVASPAVDLRYLSDCGFARRWTVLVPCPVPPECGLFRQRRAASGPQVRRGPGISQRLRTGRR